MCARLILTPEQTRTARRLLGWSQSELARQVGVSEATIAAFESSGSLPLILEPAAILAALVAAGAEFIDEGGGAATVRLATGKPQATCPAPAP